MKLREILERIKEINKVDFETCNFGEDWDGNLTYIGIKRVLYSLWNDGDNGEGYDLRYWFTYEAKVLYNILIEDVKNIEQPIIKL